MRQEIQEWVTTYPKSPGWRDGSFKGASAADYVRNIVPKAVKDCIDPKFLALEVRGSPGETGWTHTPWVAIMQPFETTTVQEGIFVVYLLSHGCDRLCLSLNQGCTTLKTRAGISVARGELRRRADVIRSRVQSHAKRLDRNPIDLQTDVWRGELYELGHVLGRTYSASRLPSNGDLIADLSEALALYDRALRSGGWTPDDEIVHDAEKEMGDHSSLEQAKTYCLHRRIERSSNHSKAVKKAQGTRCKGCDLHMSEKYGNIADGMIDAHHLTPLSALEAGKTVMLDPLKDFAVLCPNCHRVIHRLADVSDVQALRDLLK